MWCVYGIAWPIPETKDPTRLWNPEMPPKKKSFKNIHKDLAGAAGPRFEPRKTRYANAGQTLIVSECSPFFFRPMRRQHPHKIFARSKIYIYIYYMSEIRLRSLYFSCCFMLLLLLLLILLRLSFLEFAVGLFVYQKEAKKKKIANKYMETFADRIRSNVHIHFKQFTLERHIIHLLRIITFDFDSDTFRRIFFSIDWLLWVLEIVWSCGVLCRRFN